MDAFEQFASKASIPGFTVAAQSADGKWSYSKALGKCEAKHGAEDMTPETTFWIASMTKIITTIAALQCVERGLFSLETDFSTVLPEWKDPKYFAGFDERTGEPILKRTEVAVTLRDLLTHMSGLASRKYHPLASYYDSTGNPPAEWLTDDRVPLILRHEPKKVFHYGASLDMTGRMIEKVTGMKLGQYFEENIFAPLGVKDMTFHLENREDMRSRLCPLLEREEDGRLSTAELSSIWEDPIEHEYGGGGLYGTALDYVKIIAALLDGSLLKPDSIDQMFSPQLSNQKMFERVIAQGVPTRIFQNAVLGSIPSKTNVNFGLGGVLTLEDIQGARRTGSLSWSGLPNCYWWVDRGTGVCGVYCSHVVPPGDQESVELFGTFEKAVYSTITSH